MQTASSATPVIFFIHLILKAYIGVLSVYIPTYLYLPSTSLSVYILKSGLSTKRVKALWNALCT